MKQLIDAHGYYSVSLVKNSGEKSITVRVHRLLGTTFIPLVEGKNIIDHINRNKLDNNIGNLRWATYVENNNNKNDKGAITNISYNRKKNKWIVNINKEQFIYDNLDEAYLKLTDLLKTKIPKSI